MKFLVIPNCLKNETASFACRLTELLHSRGQQVCMMAEHAAFTQAPCDVILEEHTRCPEADVVIILGGDGTVLSNMHRFDLLDVPFFGINFGRIGYLTECEPDDAPRYIDAVLNHTGFIENRIVLEGKVRGGEERTFVGFNEAVIHRGCLSRALKFRVTVNGNFITDFSGDGILVATPTGSTAYNISAGGPILMPASDCFVLTPICSQFRSTCPLVVSGEDEIDVDILPVLRTGDNDDDQPRLEIDSYERLTVCPGTRIHFARSSRHVRMIKIGKDSFYIALNKKLNASGCE